MKMIERNKRKRERKGVVGNRKQRRRKENGTERLKERK
jgi:hypothetical protein